MPKCYVDKCPREATRLYEKEWGLWNIENDGNYAKSKRTLEIEIPSKDREEYHLCSLHGEQFERRELVLSVMDGFTSDSIVLEAEPIIER